MRNAILGRALLGLFILSGFAGLIYQSIWTHYLGLVLGHAAYAQTLVLGIFMGGMAIGAWIASRRSGRWQHLILAYAVIELIVGVLGILFHVLFVHYVELTQNTVLPTLTAPWAAHAWQWASSALLILPQCILLGMTFPLLSAGYLRLSPGQTGEVLGGLYFTNSLGAAVGVLVAVFLLLPAVGMPGAMLTAGLLNVAVALGAWLVWKATPLAEVTPETEAEGEIRPDAAPMPVELLVRVALISAFITGATSFVYEIGWVRLLNMALGTTLHSFELMLAAFILGLACGGLWVRERAKRIQDVLCYAGYAQVFMGLAALLSVAVFSQSFKWISGLMGALAHNDAGYNLFSGGSALVALLVMFPAAFFAGMTLPLFTTSLLRAGGGERQIGRVYASNTLGAIVGVLVMVHLLIPSIGVRLSLVLAALIDAVLGLLIIHLAGRSRVFAWNVATIATFACTALVLTFAKYDPRVLVSGVFRTGSVSLNSDVAVHYLRDGKTATVSVVADGVQAAIGTNGKTDALLSLDVSKPPIGDELTMVVAGTLPLVMHPNPERVAVIGWGSGLTTHTLLGSRQPKTVDTIEIEQAMVDGAKLFGARVERAYSDPRSRLHIDDARTYFSTMNSKFDVIVSEPSNPWVNGVASLFTEEFYRFLRGHLNEDGLLVQWVQVYELDSELLATMQAALLEVFPDSDIYLANETDLLIVAYAGKRGQPNWNVLQEMPLKDEVVRLGVSTPAEFKLRRVGGPDVLANFVRMHEAKPHSDFFPVVSLNAPRSRFKRNSATELLAIVDGGLPIADMLDGRIEPSSFEVDGRVFSRFGNRKHQAKAIADMLGGKPAAPGLFVKDPTSVQLVQSLKWLSRGEVAEADLAAWTQAVALVARNSLGQLPPMELRGAWMEPGWISPQGQPKLVTDVLRALDAMARRDGETMLEASQSVLDHDPKQVSQELRNLMVLEGQLAAIATRRPEIAAEIGRRNEGLHFSGDDAFLYSFLSAWAARHVTR